ncbi:sugar ABC transporter substrate-binding protein [Bacillus pseudomycoides]|uniref:sugar ABC transporter substrate-binding protein n=1 Tax=Bacillus pseudomycoides TaxID=64104 RepID=UPI000BF939FC|nr:sugar ABC transporter substrate-binding protein [Bacillus pseudomycoides]PFW87225.1 sugar ABC transporter substrate-binding protein [Bacillus pseudomycoides]PFX37075.1 sugar ABC transporter substrate-binding protein [Bacillus pseudomycoides]
MAVLKIHVALEEVNFLWDERQVILFREMWNSGVSLAEMVKRLKRKQVEVAVLILDQADNYKIGGRSEGIGDTSVELIKNNRSYEFPLTLYIALEEANFLWNEQDVIRFQEMWDRGINIVEIARKLKRHQIEVAVLILDLLGLEDMLSGIQNKPVQVA